MGTRHYLEQMKMSKAFQNRMRSEIRELAGAKGKPWKIEIVEGNEAPKLVGKRACYRNKSGEIIRHPSAYAAKGHRSMVYHHSTRKITVGKIWLAERGGNKIIA